jgi:hypothetical protein
MLRRHDGLRRREEEADPHRRKAGAIRMPGFRLVGLALAASVGAAALLGVPAAAADVSEDSDFHQTQISASEDRDQRASLEAKIANIERKLERALRKGRSDANIARLRRKLAKATKRLDATAPPDDTTPPAREQRHSIRGDANDEHHTGGGMYSHPPTPQDIEKAKASWNTNDVQVMRGRNLPQGIPAWCYEAPGTHGSNLWTNHCLPNAETPAGAAFIQARDYAYPSYMRQSLRITWHPDGRIKSSVCHNADGSLRDFSASVSGVLRDECSTFNTPDRASWWVR